MAARYPDLQEGIDFLNLKSDDSSVNASAAYWQHLTFMDDDMKAKIRSTSDIPALIRLLNHESIETHKSACEALSNLSFGSINNDNKRAIKTENGIPELIRLLRKTDQEDVKESVTSVLWNLSSCEDLKQSIIEDGLAVLVNAVTSNYTGYNIVDHPWTTVLRNTTGILRNVSSAGFDARQRLRECRGMINSLMVIIKLAESYDSTNLDNKSVENTVCILRNLSFCIQEVVDPDFYKKMTLPQENTVSRSGKSKGRNSLGWFSGKSKKAKNSQLAIPPPELPQAAVEYQSLWGSEMFSLYSIVLKKCTNPITIEAAAAAIQNLTACDWRPAINAREMVRKEKGLPLLVDLLLDDSERVVCATASAIRNLVFDDKNRELMGKYAMQGLVNRLPMDTRNTLQDDTICAIIASLFDMIKDNQEFALALVAKDALPRLMHINTSNSQYSQRTIEFTQTLLKTLYGFKSLHYKYREHGYLANNFNTSQAIARPDGSGPAMSAHTPSSSNHTTPYNTLSRPMANQGQDDDTLTPAKTQQSQREGCHPNSRGPSPVYGRGGMGGNLEYSRAPAEYGRLHPDYSQSPPDYRQSPPDYQQAPPDYSQSPPDYRQCIPDNRQSPPDSRQSPPDYQQAPPDYEEYMNYCRDKMPPEEVRINDMGPGYAPPDEPQPHPAKPPLGGDCLSSRPIATVNDIPELIQMLRNTDEEDVKESVTSALWNLSSCEDLKQSIIEDGLTVLVNAVISKYTGYSLVGDPWTKVLRNTTGILRNVSSAGFDARKRLRECRGMINSLIFIVKLAVSYDNTDLDNKSVENTVCILRNLSFCIQEVVDPDFYKKMTLSQENLLSQYGKSKGSLGGKSNKAKNSHLANPPPELPQEYWSLWGSEIFSLYTIIFRKCTNPITIEATAGAIQNLTACDWRPAINSREMVRKEKGLPLLIDLLSDDSERVVCATASAIRNLVFDDKNRELMGKYAMQGLVNRLPRDTHNTLQDDTICAIIATLFEVIKDNQEFALALVTLDALPCLMHINTSNLRYRQRTIEFNQTLLKTLYGLKYLHKEYRKRGYTAKNFNTSQAVARLSPTPTRRPPRQSADTDTDRDADSSAPATSPEQTIQGTYV